MPIQKESPMMAYGKEIERLTLKPENEISKTVGNAVRGYAMAQNKSQELALEYRSKITEPFNKLTAKINADPYFKSREQEKKTLLSAVHANMSIAVHRYDLYTDLPLEKPMIGETDIAMLAIAPVSTIGKMGYFKAIALIERATTLGELAKTAAIGAGMSELETGEIVQMGAKGIETVTVNIPEGARLRACKDALKYSRAVLHQLFDGITAPAVKQSVAGAEKLTAEVTSTWLGRSMAADATNFVNRAVFKKEMKTGIEYAGKMSRKELADVPETVLKEFGIYFELK